MGAPVFIGSHGSACLHDRIAPKDGRFFAFRTVEFARDEQVSNCDVASQILSAGLES